MEVSSFKEVTYPHQSSDLWWFHERVWEVRSELMNVLSGKEQMSDIMQSFSFDAGEKVPYHFDGFWTQIFSIPYNWFDKSSDDYDACFDAFWHWFTYFPTNQADTYVELYNDAKYYLWLKYEGRYIAFIWFKLSDTNTIMVTQIQWARFVKRTQDKHDKIPHNNYLKWIRWRHLLLHLLEQKVCELGFNWTIAVQSAYNNWWFNICWHREPGEKWFEAYDQIALDMWYEWEASMNYRKEI